MTGLLKRRWMWIVSGLVVLVVAGLGVGRSYLTAMSAAEFWESAIVDFEEQDRSSPPEPGAIVFTGSSSIRMWKSLQDDMAPLPVLNRGFGGSQISHVNHFASRIVLPYRPSAVVLYAGDNDLAAGSAKTPESVLGDFQRFVSIVHGADPDVPIYFLAIKPSISRWDRWPVMSEANERIARFARATDGVVYVDVATAMLGESGEPRPELFIADGLHMTAEGYALWTQILEPVLASTAGAR